MTTGPFTLKELEGWLKTDGADRVIRERLGDAALVGHPPTQPTDEKWMYKTGQYVVLQSPAVDDVRLMHNMTCWPLRPLGAGVTMSTGLRLGRAPGNHVIINHPDVSKLHARFLLGPDGFALADADSSNGTFINGIRLDVDEPHLLADRDRVTFGPASLRYLLSATLVRVLLGT